MSCVSDLIILNPSWRHESVMRSFVGTTIYTLQYNKVGIHNSWRNRTKCGRVEGSQGKYVRLLREKTSSGSKVSVSKGIRMLSLRSNPARIVFLRGRSFSLEMRRSPKNLIPLSFRKWVSEGL